MKTLVVAWAKIWLHVLLWIFSGWLLAGSPAWADESDAQVHRLHFSERPSDSEIFSARVFDEPLVAVDGDAYAGENQALADALERYARRTDSDDFSGLTGFLSGFPQSRWRGSVLLHLGCEYYNAGRYSKALDAWEQAWKTFERLDSAGSKAQADRALGELARMYSKLGRMNELERLLSSTTHRPLNGPATQLIHAAGEALWLMQNQPEICFRCGPLALDRILAHSSPAKAGNLLIQQSKSTTKGFSLSEVAELSRRLGMNYQMAFRSSGAPLIVPAVVHWKVGHYAAILERDGERVLAQDTTFRGGVWMSTAALEDETSGYFLVPPGELPTGWRRVPETEAQGVWGKGVVSGRDGNATRPCPLDKTVGGSGCSSCVGMTTYTMHAMLVDLTLQDTPVGYGPPVGPAVQFTATYNHLEANQPATFYYSNLGPKWTCNWVAYVTDCPANPKQDVCFYVDGGGTVVFTGFNATNQIYAVEMMSQALLTRSSDASYEMAFRDGSRKEFAMSDGSAGSSRRIFLTRVIDPAGNAVELKYDAQLRITNIVDAIGQATTLVYADTAHPFAITSVIDPFGRAANFKYSPSGLLAQITDVMGMTSRYEYGTNDFVKSLTTPYGTTTFETGSSGSVNAGKSWLLATDPLGEQEYLEFNQSEQLGTPYQIDGSGVPGIMWTRNSFMYARNSYFWDKKAYADAPSDYSKAQVYHWLHSPDGQSAIGMLESEKAALENRVWYTYPDQAQSNEGATYQGRLNEPSNVGRVLDDGTTQLYSYRYNAVGNVTHSIDPAGRAFTYVYDTNDVDLLEVRMTRGGKNELLRRMTYNAQHKPLTVTDAAGQTTRNAYNARGQVLSVTNRKGETTSFSYDANGYLVGITGPLQTSNDVARFAYDGFGRVRTATDTEGYTLTFDYDAMNRRARTTYPDGTSEQLVYERLDLVASCDRLGRCTTNSYNANRQLIQTQDPLGRVTGFEWCRCGALTGLIDAMGRMTTWRYDVQGRPVAKQYADGSTVTYAYEDTTSRLRSRRDEQGQQTVYEYYPDGNLKRVSYPNALVATPTVTYSYDPDYSRVLTMQDGIGTTLYSYNLITASPAVGAGLLASVTGPLPNSIVSLEYDELGRVVSRAINGVAQATSFDILGRVAAVTNALGAFQYSYVGATARLASEVYPNGQTNLYAYYDNFGDQRLKEIQHLKPDGSLLSGFGYGYNPMGNITAWTNQWDTLPMRVWLPSNDAADQLTNVISISGNSGVTNYSYAYDPAQNRTLGATNGIATRFYYNALNQLTGSDGAPVSPATYEWDAENRLTAINQGRKRSEFSYDGLGRRVRITEKTNGVVRSDSYFLWFGTKICEERDANGTTAVKRLLSEGEVSISNSRSTNYLYTRDHLGSIREALGSNGVLVARYDYDPYGQQAIIRENQKTTFGYTGYFIHGPTGLYLALARPFDGANGRWLSRDPFGETVGLNVYTFVGGDPLNRVDFLGYNWQWVDITTEWVVDFVAEGQPVLNLYQGAVEGVDPTGIASSIYSGYGLGMNRCSKSFTTGKIIGLGTGIILGGRGIRRAVKSIGTARHAAQTLPLFRIGGNGPYWSGSSFRRAEELENKIQEVRTDLQFGFFNEVAGHLLNDLWEEDNKCECQSK